MFYAGLEIVSFSLADASDTEYAALNRHYNRTKAETLPDDLPTPLAETVEQLKNIPPFVGAFVWAGWNLDKTEIVASGNISFSRTKIGRHVAQFDISVDLPYRRQGLGRALLRQVVRTARAKNRRLLMTETNVRAPAGEAFMTRLGAEKGLEIHTDQLALSEIDCALIDRWYAEGAARAAGFTLGAWDGACPDNQIEAVVKLMNVRTAVSRETLTIEDKYFTAEQIRRQEHREALMGIQCWTVYATETATGRLAGYSEVTWVPDHPQIVLQGGTAVFPEFRGLSLGRWLKAAMLARILENRPQAKFVRTDNVGSDAAMLGINQALGFKPYFSNCLWHVAAGKAQAYLAEKHG